MGNKVPDDFPVIITSYEIVIADVKFLQKYQFKYVVVDEGHRLKNFDCRLIRELKQIPAANRLLLSGERVAWARVGYEGVLGCGPQSTACEGVEKGGCRLGKGLVVRACQWPTGCCCRVRGGEGVEWTRAWL